MVYRFGPFEFDSVAGDLRRAGHRLRLRPQPCRALGHLVERQGEFVSRDELRCVIWPDGTFVHFDHGLNSCIKQIRRALGDGRTSPRYLETLVRRGYRFIAPVSAVAGHPDHGVRQRTRLRVLPVRLLSDDAGEGPMADGLGEEIVAQLATAAPAHLAIVATMATARATEATPEPDVPADYLLGTTVRMAADRVRATCQVIDARTSCVIWAGRFDASVARPIEAQSTLAERIVHETIAVVGGDWEDDDAGGASESTRTFQERW
jgi:DNA-binding winged helix-turn-helix (wHTH) protein